MDDDERAEGFLTSSTGTCILSEEVDHVWTFAILLRQGNLPSSNIVL